MAKKRAKPPLVYDIPKPDQLEISLFGPGFGECLVIHYGQGRWFTIDSSLEDDRETPSALAYLNRLGINPAEDVTHNIVSHLDGDHVGGISKLFSACESARLVCPAILSERDMLRYITFHAQTDPTTLAQTTREFYLLLQHCADRNPNTPIYVKQDTLILNENGVKLWALAPSDTKIDKFIRNIAQKIPKQKMDRRASGRLLPNDVSAACLLEIEGFSAVFGADLEETPGHGWTTILENSIAFQDIVPKVFKIAHHGSKNADSPELWNLMNEPIAMLAPFKYGRHKIPTPDDVKRILQNTNQAFSSSSFKGQKVKKLSSIDKTLRQHGVKRQQLFSPNGHVRLRYEANSEIQVDLFQNAVHLSKVH